MPDILTATSRDLLLNSLNPNLFSQAPSMHYICANNKDWSMHRISDECESITGFRRKEYLNGHVQFGSLIYPSDCDYVWQTIQQALSKKIVFKLFYRIKSTNSQTKFVFEQGSGAFTTTGKLKEIIGFITDVTHCLENHESITFETRSADCAKELKNLTDNLKFSGKDTTPYLSPREIEVLFYLCQGMSMKEIASLLNISARTIEGHISHSRIKLSCANQCELRKLFLMTNSGKQLIAQHL